MWLRLTRINNISKFRHQCRRLWQRDVIFWKRHRRAIVYWTVIVFHLFGLLSSVKAVMSTRTPQGAIAWAVSLNTCPYVAVPAYWIFGASEFEDYVISRKRARAKNEGIVTEIRDNLDARNLRAESNEDWSDVLQKLAGLPFTVKNDAELLVNGVQTYESMLEGIERAEEYVLFQFYIVRDDETGRKFRDALVRKAKQGVRVYAMYDEIGSLGLPDSFKKPLEEAGGKFIPFNTTQGFMNRFRLNFRNHRKVVVVDGREAWVGGINIGNEYANVDTAETGEYMRDTHIWMEGPVVLMVQAVFMEDWYWADSTFPQLTWMPHVSESANFNMLCLPSGPADDLETCALFYLESINNAQERIWISTPYFVPDGQIVSALTLAVMRGVDVRIMMPEETDSKLIDLSHRGIIHEVERTGVKIYHYQKGFIHQKVMLVDDRYSFVGTANFDNRSFRLNFELTMVIDDQGFAAETEKMLEGDFADAVQISEDAYKESSFFQRLFSSAALLLAPVQ